MTPPLVIPPYLKEAPLTGLIGMGGGATSRRVYTASSGDAYQIGKSLRFNDDDGAHLIKTIATGGGDVRKFTIAFWTKNCKEGTRFFSTGYSTGTATSREGYIGFNSNKITFNQVGGASGSGGTADCNLWTEEEFRDPSAWYHVVISVDTAQVLAAERVKIYVNGKLAGIDSSYNTYPGQHETFSFAKGGKELTFGCWRLNGDLAGYYDGYFADWYYIDGLQLSAAAFGSFDTAANWNPKTFALPTHNNGRTWSSNVTTSDSAGFTSGNGAAEMFDGTETDGYPVNTDETITITFNPALEVKQSIRLQLRNGGRTHIDWGSTITGTGIKQTHIKDDDCYELWPVEVDYGTNLSSLTITPDSGVWAQCTKVEVDGVVLLDGETDPETRDNPNNGTTWSDGLSGTTWSGSTYVHEHMFDGTISTGTLAAEGGSLSYSGSIGKSGDKIEIYCSYLPHANVNFTVNGTNINSQADGNNNKWFTLTGITYPITAMTFNAYSNTHYIIFKAIRVNGQILVDDAVDNSFNLKFSDASLNRYLGKDSLNGATADATGGKTIYVTSDDYGEVKGSGYNDEDSNTIRDALVLAIPGDSVASGTCDVHQQINTGSSNKTVTVNGSVTVKTDDSRLYGSSLYFAGDEDDLQFADHADFDVGTGDFTIEFWAKPTNTGAWSSIVSWPGSWDSTAQRIAFSDSGYFACGNTTTGNHVGSTVCWDGNWRHYAVVRNGTTFKGYVNGTEEFTFTTSASYDFGGLVIGRYPPSSYPSDYEYKGYVNDFRFYKGLAKYTANFKVASRNDFTVKSINHASSTGTTTGGSWSTAFRKDGTGQFSTRDAWVISSGDSMSTNGNAQVTYVDTQDLGDSYELTIEDTGGANDIYLATTASATTTSWTLIKNNNTKLIFTPGGFVNVDGTIYTHERYVRFEGAGSGYLTITITGVLDLDEGTSSSVNGIDSFTDSPTNYGDSDTGVGGELRGNYPTWNPLDAEDAATLAHGNLSYINDGSTWNGIRATMAIPAGKWYWEYHQKGSDGASYGIASRDTPLNDHVGGSGSTPAHTWGGANWYQNGSGTATGLAAMAEGDVIGVAYDTANGKLHFSRNGQWYGASWATKTSSQVAAGTDPVTSSVQTDVEFFPAHSNYSTGKGCHVNFGQRAFIYTAPTNFKALCTQNFSDTFSGSDVNNPSKFFDATKWQGDGVSPRTIELDNGDFTPDLVWLKNKTTSGRSHYLYDAIRTFGSQKELVPNSNVAEGSNSHLTQNHGYVSAVGDSTFTLGSGATNQNYTNNLDDHFSSWSWDAGTAASGANTNGTIDIASGDQWVNDTAGFSMTKFTGTGADATFGHGLSAKPEFLVIKKTSATGGDGDWTAQHVGATLGSGRLIMNENYANDTSNADTYWNSTAPTSTVISIGDHNNTNTSGQPHMCYAWRSVAGFSKFGSYTGNAAADGPFVYLGFRPRMIIFKNISTTNGWRIQDTAVNPYNSVDTGVYPNNTSVEDTAANWKVDYLSNGFKIKDSNNELNGSGNTIIYMAWAENPFKTARAR